MQEADSGAEVASQGGSFGTQRLPACGSFSYGLSDSSWCNPSTAQATHHHQPAQASQEYFYSPAAAATAAAAAAAASMPVPASAAALLRMGSTHSFPQLPTRPSDAHFSEAVTQPTLATLHPTDNNPVGLARAPSNSPSMPLPGYQGASAAQQHMVRPPSTATITMTPQVAPIPMGHIPAAAVADQDMEDITMLDDDGSDIGDDDDDMGDDSGATTHAAQLSEWRAGNASIVLESVGQLSEAGP